MLIKAAAVVWFFNSSIEQVQHVDKLQVAVFSDFITAVGSCLNTKECLSCYEHLFPSATVLISLIVQRV